MTPEQKYRELLSQLENDGDAEDTDSLLDELLGVARRCYFTRAEWFENDTRLDMLLAKLRGGPTPHGLVN